MRNPDLFTPEKCWTAAESDLADRILAALRSAPTSTLAEIVELFRRSETTSTTDQANLDGVSDKLEEFPHIFEVADARDELAA